MSNFIFSDDKYSVSPQEVISLYDSVGWGSASDYEEEDIAIALKNTTLVLSARTEDGRLMGLTKCLSDGVFHTVVAEIIVHPDVQRFGIGRKMMELVQRHYGHTGIYADSLAQNEEFFVKCGLRKSNLSVFSRKSSGRLPSAQL